MVTEAPGGHASGPRRRHGCRVQRVVVEGHEQVVIENRGIRVTVWPGMGADITEFRHKPTDTDVLWQSPWAPRPAGAPQPWAATAEDAFLDRYHGGWQEMFPLCGGPAEMHGARVGVHGEACMLPWRWWVEVDRPDEVAVQFEVDLIRTPFRLRRRMSVRAGQPALVLEERVTNLGDVGLDFMWGHHPAFGAPFLKGGCRIATDARTVLTSSLHDDPASRLLPDQRSGWPNARTRDGGTVDLSLVPGDDVAIHDWAYLTDFAEGWFAIREPEEGIGFACRFPAATFPYLLYWQNFRGARAAPWYGRAYVGALEPQSTFPADFASGAPLLHLEAGASLDASLTASAFQSDRDVTHVDAMGVVT